MWPTVCTMCHCCIECCAGSTQVPNSKFNSLEAAPCPIDGTSTTNMDTMFPLSIFGAIAKTEAAPPTRRHPWASPQPQRTVTHLACCATSGPPSNPWSVPRKQRNRLATPCTSSTAFHSPVLNQTQPYRYAVPRLAPPSSAVRPSARGNARPDVAQVTKAAGPAHASASPGAARCLWHGGTSKPMWACTQPVIFPARPHTAHAGGWDGRCMYSAPSGMRLCTPVWGATPLPRSLPCFAATARLAERFACGCARLQRGMPRPVGEGLRHTLPRGQRGRAPAAPGHYRECRREGDRGEAGVEHLVCVHEQPAGTAGAYGGRGSQ